MQKIYFVFTFLFLYSSSNGQTGNNKDVPLRISSLKISIKANSLTAETVVEMDLLNPNDKVLDGEVNFFLAEGQVITAFALDINGKMREGVVVEKQKARVAYENTIRRKIDPGLLEMTAANQYRIRVYPVPAKGGRKISFTIYQLLVKSERTLDYFLPVEFSTAIDKLTTNVEVTGVLKSPMIKDGILIGNIFQLMQNRYSLYWEKENVISNAINFSIPLDENANSCTEEIDCINFFASRIALDLLPLSRKKVNQVTIFWDVSLSSEKRNQRVELEFLHAYLKELMPQELTIVTFNIAVVEVKKVSRPFARFNSIKNFLESQVADGGTRLGALDCAAYPADEYLLFTDGFNTFGNTPIKTNNRPVFVLQSLLSVNSTLLKQIASATSGKCINLATQKPEQAVMELRLPEWQLRKIGAGKNLQDITAVPVGKSFIVSGKLTSEEDSLVLYFQYGNAEKVEKLYLRKKQCPSPFIQKAFLLTHYQRLLMEDSKTSPEKVFNFADANSLVSESTSLIVLDNLEDYYLQEITPPKELLEEFNRRYTVKSNKAEQRKKRNEMAELEKLQSAVAEYNQRIKWWNSGLPTLTLKEPVQNVRTTISENRKELETQELGDRAISTPTGFKNSAALQEVVVVGYATNRRRALTGSSTTVSGDQLSSSTTVLSALQGRVAGLHIADVAPGANSSVSLRGYASIRGGNEPLYVVDGIPVESSFVANMSTYDIESINVLKDAASTALYGIRGANGVIVITTKRGIRTPPNVQKEEEDLAETLIFQLEEIEPRQRYDKYLQRRKEVGDNPLFYFQMASYFFDNKNAIAALKIISNLAEMHPEDHQLLRTLGYILEEQKDYKNAISVYETVLRIKEEEPQSYRDLALAYALNGDHQQAVNLLYTVLKKDWNQYEERYSGLRDIILNELNMLLTVARSKLEVSAINPSIVQALPVDLRVVIDWNKDETDIDLHVVEPDGEQCSYSHRLTKNGGRITDDFTDGYGPEEYEIKDARKGTYKIKVHYYSDRYQKVQVPAFIKLSIYKNYGKPNQTMIVKTSVLDGEEGMIDLAEVKF